MKTLVVLLGLASVALASWVPAVPHDTAEVSAAKAAHFAAHAAARGWGPNVYAGHWGHATIGPNGVPLDTPEVATAKANHLAALAAARSSGSWNNDGQWHGEGLWESQAGAGAGAGAWTAYGHGAKWTGPIALPPGYDANGAPLPVQDTPEVAAAKSNHLAILHGAHVGAYSGAHDWNNNGQWNAALWGDHSHRWRRSAVLLTRTPGSTLPLVHSVAVAAPVVHAPLVRNWGYTSIAPVHHW